MSTLLTSKSAGYYMKKDVFGHSGDFITAPEISQLFGEMVALNFLSKIELNNRSSNRAIHLIELGPGRGTLLDDILRTFSAFPSFFKNVKKCSLVEMSPILKDAQFKKLQKWAETCDLEWTENVEGLIVEKDDLPVFIAQEFFDAIPIHVFKKCENGGWKELKVAAKMCLIEQHNGLADLLKVTENFTNYPNEQTLELSPLSWSICHHIRKIFDKCQRGEGIIIDYGQFKPSTNSLRGIYKHQFCSIFDHVGDSDLSADVDFQSLMHYLGPDNKYNFMTQGEFLESKGIRKRAAMLSSNNEDIDKAVERLVNSKEMGSMYKVLEFSLAKPPKMAKAKKEKAPLASSVDPGELSIINYLKTQNRPYSAVDIFNNLHGAVGKTAVVKILTSLSERGEITAKAYGKQWVYVARQDLLPVPSSEELNAIDDEINVLKDSLQTEKEQMKSVQTKLNVMNSSLTSSELQKRISSLEIEVVEMHERLEPLERGTVKVDPEERARIDKQFEIANKAWKQRKKLCTDIIGMLTESISKKPVEFMEELGMEIDPV